MFALFRFSRFSLFSLMLVAFLVGGTQIGAIDNPPPCTDPWVCDYNPVIGGTISGPASPCHGESVTYTITETKTAGQRSHCKITDAVSVTSISWTWTVTGPAGTPSKSGSGKTLNNTFSSAGDYTISFTGKGEVSGVPCYCDDVTVTKQVTVAGDSGEATLSDAQECPGGTAVLTWKITNTGHCSALFSYTAYELEGDLKVTVTPTFGSTITLAAGASATGTLQVAIAADSTTGDKKIGMKFSTMVTSGVAYPKGLVTVPPHKAKAFISSLPDCPVGDMSVLFGIENTGCKGTFTWEITTATPGVTVINQGNPPVDLAAGNSTIRLAKFRVDPDLFQGNEINYKIEVSTAPEGILDTATGKAVCSCDGQAEIIIERD